MAGSWAEEIVVIACRIKIRQAQERGDRHKRRDTYAQCSAVGDVRLWIMMISVHYCRKVLSLSLNNFFYETIGSVHEFVHQFIIGMLKEDLRKSYC